MLRVERLRAHPVDESVERARPQISERRPDGARDGGRRQLHEDEGRAARPAAERKRAAEVPRRQADEGIDEAERQQECRRRRPCRVGSKTNGQQHADDQPGQQIEREPAAIFENRVHQFLIVEPAQQDNAAKHETRHAFSRRARGCVDGGRRLSSTPPRIGITSETTVHPEGTQIS